jgi:hypothetical protein
LLNYKSFKIIGFGSGEVVRIYFMKRIISRIFNFSLIVGFLLLSLSANIFAQIGFKGGRGLFRVQDAAPVQRGDLYFGGNYSTFSEKGSTGGLVKDHHFSIHGTYGLSNSLELTAHFVAYQDDQAHIWGPIGDTEIAMKFLIPIGQDSPFKLGIRNSIIFPTAINHNVSYEPFTADKIGWSPGLAASIDFTDLIYFPIKFYFNGGYIDRSLAEELFSDDIDQTYLGAGFKFSIKNIIFFWEYYTEQFANRDDIAFSENYQVSSQGITFLGPSNLIFTLGGDINLAEPTKDTFFKNKQLADWKIWFGISKYISFNSYLNEASDRRRREQERNEDLKKQQLIRQERISSEEELKKMQELLKKQEKDKKKKKKG